ncbi:MAG: diacylglycerol kinase family protein [Endozoicomonas sp.]
MFSLTARVNSFRYGINGLVDVVRHQHNARVHLFATVAVIGAGLFLQVAALEWCLLVIAMVLVWITELLNTALEYLCDRVSLEFHPLVKKSKDIAAGAVLVSAAGAATIGLIIFLPYICRLF